MKKALSITKIALGWPLSIAAFFFIIKIILPSLKNFYSHVKTLNWEYILISFILFCLFYALRCLLWHNILKAKGHKIPFAQTGYLWSMSELKRYVPGSIWSFLARAHSFSRKKVPGKTTAKSIIIEISSFTIGSILAFLPAVTFSLHSVLHYRLILIVKLTIITLSILLSLVYVFSRKILSFYKGRLSVLLKEILPNFPPFLNLFNLSISILYMLAFGFGTYFAIQSIFGLPAKNILELSSFFVFAYFIGYASLITPMGLGVREAVMAIGIKPLLGLSAAGFAAVFSRVIFIFSELIFLLFTYLWIVTFEK